MSDRRRGSIRQAPDADSREPAGPHVGPIPITATGVLLLVALVASLVFFAYTITVRESTQIPLVVSGSVVLGLVFAAIAAVGGRATWRSSVQGRDARAFGHSLLGGIAALIAAACFAGAIILILIKG
jgi:uncharacterized YccA/Bax inhibitor family protein